MENETEKIFTTAEIRHMTHEERIQHKDEIIKAINEDRIRND